MKYSEEHLEEHLLFRQILEFSIDNYSDEDELYGILNFNETMFFENLFINRRKVEKRLDQLLRYSNNLITISGDAGCGKTSVVRKFLRSRINQDRVFILDLKKESEFEEKLFEIKEKVKNNTEQRQHLSLILMRQVIKNRLRKRISSKYLFNRDVCQFLFLSKQLDIANQELISKCEDYLYSDLQLLEIELKEKLIKEINTSREFRELWNELSSSLTIRDYIRFYKNHIGNKLTFLFDNIDSFDSLKDQYNLIHFYRSLKLNF